MTSLFSGEPNAGFTILYATLVASIVLAFSASMASLVVRETRLAGLSEQSQTAAQAADTGIECAMYWDGQGAFSQETDIICGNRDYNVSQVVGNIQTAQGTESDFEVFLQGGEICAQVRVTKSGDNTAITSYGYAPCDADTQQVRREASVEYVLAPPACSDPTVLEVRVDQSRDDAEECLPTGNMYTNSSDLELVHETPGGTCDDADQAVGTRFQDVTIPPESTIASTWIEFTGANEPRPDSIANLTFYGQDSDNTFRFSGNNGNITNRPKTSASVDWNNLSGWQVGEKYRTPDLSEIVQEIIDLPGWESGNSLAMITEGSGVVVAEAWDGEPNNAPLLRVEYCEAGSTINWASLYEARCEAEDGYIDFYPADSTYTVDLTCPGGGTVGFTVQPDGGITETGIYDDGTCDLEINDGEHTDQVPIACDEVVTQCTTREVTDFFDASLSNDAGCAIAGTGSDDEYPDANAATLDLSDVVGPDESVEAMSVQVWGYASASFTQGNNGSGGSEADLGVYINGVGKDFVGVSADVSSGMSTDSQEADRTFTYDGSEVSETSLIEITTEALCSVNAFQSDTTVQAGANVSVSTSEETNPGVTIGICPSGESPPEADQCRRSINTLLAHRIGASQL